MLPLLKNRFANTNPDILIINPDMDIMINIVIRRVLCFCRNGKLNVCKPL